MALNTRLGVAARNAAIDAICALVNGGYLRLYDGSQPATPADAPGATLLAELTLNATAFQAAVNGQATANAITDDSSANAGGTATWCRVLKSDGTTAIWDGSVGTATANVVLNSTSISAGARVSISSMTFSLPMQGS
jgi:hypothetical protein